MSASKIKVPFLSFFLLIYCLSASSQEIPFTKGLALPLRTQYGREAVYVDQLAFRLYQGTLKAPADGDIFGNDAGREIKWRAVTTDTSGRFQGAGSPSGYLYLTYNSPTEQVAVLNISGNNTVYVNGELHMGDPYAAGYMLVPVRLRKGANEFYVRGTRVKANLRLNPKALELNTGDLTLPTVIPGKTAAELTGAVVVMNNTAEAVSGLTVQSIFYGQKVSMKVASVPARSSRKVPFRFNAAGASKKEDAACQLRLLKGGAVADEKNISIEVTNDGDKYKETFYSGIDGSLQYYAITPKKGPASDTAALFFSVHGAGVEAISQARAYHSKDWGTVVAPTNRRPRGFNWEDWGRLDALEVLDIAKNKLKPDPSKIYLTGHSMGGHGTWFLGATYPDKWAAIAPCAGYPSLKGYGSADGLIPENSPSPVGRVLLSAGNQSDVPKLVTNYKPLGVYVHHGDADETVSVNYSRDMKKLLAGFHADYSYYEYPNGSHWFGGESVDWNPIFEFFKWHRLKADTAVHTLDFMTASPGISATMRWATVWQQEQPLQYSHIILRRDLRKKSISGTAENVHLLKLKLTGFGANSALSIAINNSATIAYTTKSAADSLFLVNNEGQWQIAQAPSLTQKGPHRYGTFKEPFSKKMVFVYGTAGTAAENSRNLDKARFDAESWWYRGNGAVDVISDKDYSLKAYAGRNVVLYGNAESNAAWKILLSDCPIAVNRNSVTLGKKTWRGDDLAAYFMWPVKGTTANTVAVISGTGSKGADAAMANQYFAGGSGFPDYMIFGLDMLEKGVDGVKAAGFYTNDWQIAENEK